MKTALITGISGQDGSYLAEHLLDLGYQVYGLVRRELAALGPGISLIGVDIPGSTLLSLEPHGPAHLIAFVYESGAPPGGSAEWLVDLGRTAALSAEAQLPDPLGEIS